MQEKKAAQSSLDTIAPHLSKRLLKEHILEMARFPELQKNANVHMELAKICLNKNLFDLALAEGFVTVKLNPQSAEGKYRLALILENDKHYYPAALQYLREAQVLEPYNQSISQHLMRLEDRLTINKSDWGLAIERLAEYCAKFLNVWLTGGTKLCTDSRLEWSLFNQKGNQ